MKIIFFIDSLCYGGKERRMLELIKYLKQNTDYSLSLVLTDDKIHFKYVYELDIPIVIMKREGTKYDPRLFARFYNYCRQNKPDIIHTWGKMATFYAIPVKIFQKIPLIANLVADAQTKSKFLTLNYIFFNLDILFANVILSNSIAGLKTHKVNSSKAKVIRNGVYLERFEQTFDRNIIRENLKVNTRFLLVMVATFSKNKDYDLFLEVAKKTGNIRKDVTFIGVGDGADLNRIKDRIESEQIHNVILTGKLNNVESIVAASDIGILCTYSEGISNSIIEYMALGKPVISTDILGGSNEIIVEGVTGYCVERDAEKVVNSISSLLNNESLRTLMGKKGRERIISHFSIQRMGEEFVAVYKEVLSNSRKK